MYITLHLTDGRKITKERENLIILRPESMLVADVVPGKITVNWQNVVDMREAEEDEVSHARIHGW